MARRGMGRVPDGNPPRKKRGTNMHVGGHLRNAFLDAVDGRDEDVRDISSDTLVEGDHRGRELTWDRLLGLLWNCTDTVPKGCCEDLEFPQGSTYAQIAQSIKPVTIR